MTRSGNRRERPKKSAKNRKLKVLLAFFSFSTAADREKSRKNSQAENTVNLSLFDCVDEFRIGTATTKLRNLTCVNECRDKDILNRFSFIINAAV